MSLRLFGTHFSIRPAAEVLGVAATQAREAGPRLVVTANVDHVVILAENPAFRKAYDGAAARTLDGMPLVWLARLQGREPVTRVTGHDLLAAALARPITAEDRIFLVCSSAEVGRRVAARFVARGHAPETIVSLAPPFGFDEDERYSSELARRVRNHGTTLLVMGVGAPKSEVWVDRQGKALGDPLVLAVGEALNVAAGLVPRAPRTMQRLGLEWLFRFLLAPRRLFRRYFVRSWRFLRIVATEQGRRTGLVQGLKPTRTDQAAAAAKPAPAEASSRR